MAEVEVWKGRDFKTTHERKALESIIHAFNTSKSIYSEKVFMLSNFILGDREIDLTIIKSNSIAVVELKKCGESFTATENLNWVTSDGYVIGSKNKNPYQQLREYRFKWIDFIQKHKKDFFPNGINQTAIYQIFGLVVIDPSLRTDIRNKIPKETTWFQLIGLDKIDLEFFTLCSELIFQEESIRKIIKELRLTPQDPSFLYNYFQVPFIKNPDFIKDQKLIAKVEKILNKKRKPIILTGLGGVGKTQFMIEFAYEKRVNFPSGVFWIDAKKNIIDEFSNYANQFGLIIDYTENKQSLKQTLALAFLEKVQNSSDTLLLFDNIVNQDFFEKFMEQFNIRIEQLNCKVICSSTMKNFSGFVEIITMEALKPDQALELFLIKSGRNELFPYRKFSNSDSELKLAKNICESLGYLPLGIEIAGSYLSKNPHISFLDFLGSMKKIGAINIPSYDESFTPTTIHTQNLKITLEQHINKIDSEGEINVLNFLALTKSSNYCLINQLSIFIEGKLFNYFDIDSKLDDSLNQLESLNLLQKLNENQIWIHPLILSYLKEIFHPGLQAREAFFNNFNKFYNEFVSLKDSIVQRTIDEVIADFVFGLSLIESPPSFLNQLFKCLLIIKDRTDQDENQKLFFQQLRNTAFHNGFPELVSKTENYLRSNKWSYFSEKYSLSCLYQGIIMKKKITSTDILLIPNSYKYLELAPTGKLELFDLKLNSSEFINDVDFSENFYDLKLSSSQQHVIVLSSVLLSEPISKSSIKYYTNHFYIWDILSKNQIHLESTKSFKFDGYIEFISDNCIGYSTEVNQIVFVDFIKDKIIGICDAHNLPIVSIKEISNSQFVIIASEEKIILWDLKSSKLAKELHFRTKIKEVKLIEKGNLAFIFSMDNVENTYLTVWNYKLNTKLFEWKNGIYWIELSDNEEEKRKLLELEKKIKSSRITLIANIRPRKKDESHFLVFEEHKIAIFEGAHCIMMVNYESGKIEKILPYSQRFESLLKINKNTCILISDNKAKPNNYPGMLIDIEKFDFVPLFINASHVTNHTFSNGQDVLVEIQGQILTIWDVLQLERNIPISRIYDKVYLSPKKDYIIASNEKDKSLIIINPINNEINYKIQNENKQFVFNNTFLSGGEKIAFQTIEENKNHIVVWKVLEKTVDSKYEVDSEGHFQCVEIVDGQIQILPLQQEEYIFDQESMTLETLEVKTFYFSSANGGYKCDFGNNGFIKLFDLVSNNLINELDVNFQWPKKVMIESNGRFMVIIGKDNLVKLWNLNNSQIEFEGELPNIESEIRFSTNLEI
jgi:WD40 repeat protein